jgi:iron complex transport system substrate-binding protein
MKMSSGGFLPNASGASRLRGERALAMSAAMPRPFARLARHCLWLLPIAATAAPAASGGTPPHRIVSLNLCADQYLLALADPGQIAAHTQFARDPEMSAAPAAARGVPTSKGTAEDVVALDPDLVITTPGRRVDTMAALAGQHYRTLELPEADSYADIVTQIRTVAAAVGHRDRGEALIARMNAALAHLPKPAPHGIAAYYQRRGYLTGTGTLVDDLMKRVGLTNLAGKLGRPALSQLSLEQIVAAHPDYLIVEQSTDHVTDLGTEMLHHPALAGIPRLELPQAWTVCGGPSYVLAAQSLSNQLRRHR